MRRSFSNVMPEAVIGDFFVGNSFVSIGHDAFIGDFVHMNPHVFISGKTIVSNNVYIGVRATILPCRIGENSVIGACALVTKDVPPNMLAKGMPAKYYEMPRKEF